MTPEDAERLECLAWAIDEASVNKGMLIEDEEIEEWEANIEKAREAYNLLKSFLE